MLERQRLSFVETATMPSRKKARGRQNRARKEAAHQRSQWEPTILRNDGVKNSADSCEHLALCPTRIPQDGPVVSFMNCLAVEGFFDKAACFPGDLVLLCIQPLLRFPRVQEEASQRSLATNLLLRFIRNTFVHDAGAEGEKWFQGYRSNETVIFCMINLLEIRETYSDWEVVKRRSSRMSNRVAGGNRRDAVKYVAKRLPCTCLKELHSAARKKLNKVGLCINCLRRYPRSQLHVCTGCKYAPYCSRECQRANWSLHKQYCGRPEVMARDLPSDYVF